MACDMPFAGGFGGIVICVENRPKNRPKTKTKITHFRTQKPCDMPPKFRIGGFWDWD